jgi:hypothetical protein
MLVRVIIFLVILFSIRTESSAGLIIQSYSVEMLSGSNDEIKINGSDNDSLSQDEIEQPYKFNYFEENRHSMQVSYNSLIIFNHTVSVWHPPRVS